MYEYKSVVIMDVANHIDDKVATWLNACATTGWHLVSAALDRNGKQITTLLIVERVTSNRHAHGA